MSDLHLCAGWCIWIRAMGGPWIALESTWSYTRSESIKKYDGSYERAAPQYRRMWCYKNRRRRGQARCVKSVMSPKFEGDLA